MKKDKWYVKLISIITILILLPLFLVGLLVFVLSILYHLPADKKTYTGSFYYHDFRLPFKLGILFDDAYRFYNSAVERNLNIHFNKPCDNAPTWFTYQNIKYIFPWFSQLSFSKEEARWEINCDGEWMDLNQEYISYTQNIMREGEESRPYVLIERASILDASLNELTIPDYIHVVNTYETAFENDESAINIQYPTNADDLYRMMCETPELGGTYQLSGDSVIWQLNSDFRLELSISPQDYCIQLYKGWFPMTHWHPEQNEILNDIYRIGLKGHVLIIRKSLLGESVLYRGNQSECPYPESLKWKWGKIYHIIPDRK